jgi:pseudaminic acid cytidylyltransferase
MRIAVIPARGGSKRIPRKNIKDFCGRPMIAWTIGLAQKSCLFESIIVSTDDEEIAELARKWGALTPFVRPGNLADDHTPTAPVIAHSVRACIELGWRVNQVCCIYPCNPFLMSSDLIAAFDLMQSHKADFIYPVTEFTHPIQRAMRHLPNGMMQFYSPEHELMRTQDLEKSYHDAGQFYWGNALAWLEQKKMHTDGLGMAIPNWRVVDIDNQDDWRRAELIFKAINSSPIK